MISLHSAATQVIVRQRAEGVQSILGARCRRFESVHPDHFWLPASAHVRFPLPLGDGQGEGPRTFAPLARTLSTTQCVNTRGARPCIGRVPREYEPVLAS